MQYSCEIVGRLQFDPPRPGMKRNTERWAVIKLDRELTRYYRWWIKQAYHIQLREPSWNAHCSAIRGERIINPELWGNGQGEPVVVKYSPTPLQIPNRPEMWYLPAQCKRITELREQFGLRTFHDYHITVGRLYHEDCFR